VEVEESVCEYYIRYCLTLQFSILCNVLILCLNVTQLGGYHLLGMWEFAVVIVE